MKNENPSAFPEPFVNDPNLAINHTKGMTLRDYFAAKAMQGELSAQNFSTGEHWANEIDLAQRAYLVADAMLKERLKTNN